MPDILPGIPQTTLRLPTAPMETPDPPSDTPGASKQVVLTPHDIPRSLREQWLLNEFSTWWNNHCCLWNNPWIFCIELKELSGGNSNIFYVHPEPWGHHPIWLIFSNGLNPPTRRTIWWIGGWLFFFFCGKRWQFWGETKIIMTSDSHPWNGKDVALFLFFWNPISTKKSRF